MVQCKNRCLGKRLKQFSVTFHMCKNLTLKVYIFQMACAYLLPIENEHYYYIHIVKTIHCNNKWRKVVKKGGFEPDMVNNIFFWGTPKIKKFVNNSIKVYEDEIYSTSAWYHQKARSSQIINTFEILIPVHFDDEILYF